MLKKEILDTLKQTTLILSFLLLVPLIFGINQIRLHEEDLNLMWYFDWSLSYLIPSLIIYLAYNVFASEDSDGASEYLRTLPMSRWKLLAGKIFPRFVVLMILVLLYEAFFHDSHAHMAEFGWFANPQRPLYPVHLVLLILAPLIYGFMLGISDRKSVILPIAFAIPVLYLTFSGFAFFNPLSHVLYNLWWPRFPHTDIDVFFRLNSIVLNLIPVLLPMIALIPEYKSWDCSSGKIRSTRILKRMSFPLGLLIVLYSLSQFKLF